MKTKAQIEKEIIIQEIEDEIKQAADERGEIIENIIVSFLDGEIDEQTYKALLADVCGQEKSAR